MYDIGSYVMYGNQGVCQILELRREDFSGEWKDYYILSPLDDAKMTIYVPMDAEALLARMRPLLSREEVAILIREGCAAEPMEWIHDARGRSELFRQILQSGNQHRLMVMLRTIYQRREEQMALGKKLYSADETAFEKAEKLLHGEIAAVLNIQPDQVQDYIQSQLSAEG